MTKLIIVTGMSGSGKSTTSQEIARLYRLNGVESHWYHEEMEEHAIRWADGGEFKAVDIRTKQGMTRNIEDILDRWNRFLNRIIDVQGVHVMEGCLYQNIVRYFYDAGTSDDEIMEFYDRLMSVLERVEVHIVFLYPKDVKKTLDQAFVTRGERWKDLILKPEERGYYEKNKYIGDESVYRMYTDYRDLSNQIFERYKGNKIRIEVEGIKEEWLGHMKGISKFLGIDYFKLETISQIDREKYLGDLYKMSGEKTGLKILQEDQNLFLSTSWFKHMKMNCTKVDYFELSGFPIFLTFEFVEGKRRVTIGGNYGWDINGEVFEVRS